MSGKPPNPNQPIIIKKIIKKGGAAHGGSWKVAYADFVTAMMAFFLLMWLLNMTSPAKRAGIASYFKFYNMFDKASAASIVESSGEEASKISITAKSRAEELELEKGKGNFSKENKDKKAKLKEEIESKLADFKSHIKVLIFDEGIRVEIMDNEGKPIFPLGSSGLTPNGTQIFDGICESIKDLHNRIIIEGHTDALTYATDKYTNWELSTERASTARRELQKGGIDVDRLYLVAGYAATSPLIKENPEDPRNRRISLMLLIPNDKPFR